MRKYLPGILFLLLACAFSWKFFVYGLLPIPADSLVGLYHPYRDFYSANYPNGIPFKNFLITDPVRQQYPWRELAITDIKNGVFPSWNPYSFSGTPLAANYQSAAFYPLNILFAVFSFETAWSILVIIQPFLAGLFMYLFLSVFCKTLEARIFGAVVFAFSSVAVTWFTWNTLIHTFLWVPLILFSFERLLTWVKKTGIKELILYGLLMYLGLISFFLAGHAQVALYGSVIVAVYVLYRIIDVKKIDRRALTVLIIALSLSGLTVYRQLSELFYFIRYSNRTIDSGTMNQEGWFIPVQQLLQFVAPDFFGNPATLNYWGEWNYGELTGYVGILGLVFALFGAVFNKSKHKYFFIVFLILGILFSVRNPLSVLPFKFGMPFLSTSQPTRLLFVVIFSLVGLIAVGLEEFITNVKTRAKIFYIIGGLCALLGFVWLSVLGRMNLFNLSDFLENIQIVKRNLYLPSALLIFSSLIIAFLVYLPTKKHKYSVFLTSSLIAVLIFDLFRFGWKFTPFVEAEYLYPSTKTMEFLNKQSGLYRVMSTDDRILPPNVTIPHKIQTIDGYDPLYLKNYGELASAIIRNKPDISPFLFNRIITIHDPENRLIDFMNVKYVLSLTDISNPKLTKVFEEGQTRIYENSELFQRAFLVSNYKKANSKQEAIDLLYDQSIDLHSTAITFDDIEISRTALTGNEEVEITNYANSIVEIEVSTDEARLLVLSDVYYPKWKVYVDGKESHLYEVNYAFRGVVVPPGNHTILFKYI